MTNREKKRNSRVGMIFGDLIILRLEKIKRPNGSHLYVPICKCNCCGVIKKIPWYGLSSGQVSGCGKKRGRKRMGNAMTKLYSGYKGRAKRRGIEFKLTIEEFEKLISQNCYYCEYPPSMKMQSHSKIDLNDFIMYSSIDRVDSKGVYELGNSVSCCEFCNRAKNDRSVYYFLEWLNFVKTN